MSSLNVNPKHADSGSEGSIVVGHEGLSVTLAVVAKNLKTVRLQRVQSVVHLFGWISARIAREDVPINIAHATRPGIVDAVGS